MPTIAQMLTDAKERFPTQLSDTSLLNYGNEILRKIWKWLASDDIYQFDLIASQATYSLPSNGLNLDMIGVLEIATDSTLETYDKYVFKGLLEEYSGNKCYYDAYNGLIGLLPVPEVSITNGATLFYGKKFALMSTGDTSVTPAIDEDYHSLIVNYMCMKAANAGNNPDTDRHNDFAIAFNDDWGRAMFDWTRKKCTNPKKKRCNKQWK